MDENTARYIVRMLESYASNVLFLDSTKGDATELTRMKKRHEEAGGWANGSETAKAEFIMRIAEKGVPGGKPLHKGEAEDVDYYLAAQRTPRIVRPIK